MIRDFLSHLRKSYNIQIYWGGCRAIVLANQSKRIGLTSLWVAPGGFLPVPRVTG